MTFAVLLLSFNNRFLASPLLLLATVYLFDRGHVYSTMLEVYADPEELRKAYVWFTTLIAFSLNLIILFFFNESFFYYIFYFTIFHNMRQGLGVTFLYRKGEKEGMLFYKVSYYFLTIFPLLIFHFRPRQGLEQMSDAIIKSIDLSQFYPAIYNVSLYKYGLIFYCIIASIIGLIIWLKKYTRGFTSLVFFFLVYAFAFILSRNELQSYLILIASHAIPYFFLMEKRLAKTHSFDVIKKYSIVFVALTFILGGILEFYNDAIVDYFQEADVLIRALLTTPLITHFLFDGLLWKRGNERFKTFLKE